MKRLAVVLITVLAGCWLNAATAADTVDNMTLNGMSTYTELLQPYYIGALYLKTPTNDEGMILDSHSRRRIELRVIAKDYTPRQFATQWTQALLINTPQNTLNEFDDAFVQWLNIAQHGLVQGDRIVVDSYPDGHSVVRLDGVEIYQVKQPGFMDMLLGAWIGKRPPSSEFKHDILNMTYDASVVAQYDGLAPGKQRVALVKDWASGKDEEASQVAKNEHHEAAHEHHEEAAKRAEHHEESHKAAAAVAAAAPAAAAAAKPSAPTAARHEAASKHETVAEAHHAAKASEEKSKSSAVASASTKGKKSAAAGKPMQVAMVGQSEVEKKPEDDAVYRAQQALLLKLYKSAIIKRTLRKVSYPQRAVDRNQQGEVDVDITVARNGEVQDISLSKETRYRMLNDAAKRAVAATGRYPVVPAALEGDTVTVTIPVKFRLR